MLNQYSARFVATLTALLLCSPTASGAPPSSAQYVQGLVARRLLFGQGRPAAQVMVEVNQLIKVKPSWEAFFRRAFLRYQSNQFASAAQDCEQSLKLKKSQAVYYVLAASSLLQGPGSWTKALQAAAGMAAANPEAIYANECVAYIAALRGDFACSLDHLAAYNTQVALTSHNRYEPPLPGIIGGLSPEDSQRITAMLGKSQKQAKQRLLLSALAAYFRNDYAASAAACAELSPSGAGRTDARRGEDDLALALSICNDQMLARPAGIEKNALKLVQQTGECQASLSLLDTTYFSLDQRDKSLTFINHLIERQSARAVQSKTNAKLIDLLFARACLHEQMGETRSALQDCQAILKLQPDQRKARLDFCRYKLTLGESQGSLADLNKYVDSYPADAVARFLRAQIFVLDKKWQPAVRDLSLTIDGGYYLLKSLQARAACYRAMHQDQLATNDMELVAKFKADNSLVLDLGTTPKR